MGGMTAPLHLIDPAGFLRAINHWQQQRGFSPEVNHGTGTPEVDEMGEKASQPPAPSAGAGTPPATAGDVDG